MQMSREKRLRTDLISFAAFLSTHKDRIVTGERAFSPVLVPYIDEYIKDLHLYEVRRYSGTETQ